MDAETLGEELNGGTHPEGLMRSNLIVHRFARSSRLLHAQHIGLALVRACLRSVRT
jgi:hypothetical protein